MINKNWFGGTFLGAVLSLVTPVKASDLLFVADHFPPYEYANPAGKAHGFDTEVIKVAFERVGMNAKFEFLPWKRVVSKAKKGEATVFFSCAKKNGREEYAYFSDVLSTTTQGIISKKSFDISKLNTLADLKNIRVASVVGYASNSYLDNAKLPYDTVQHISNVFPMLKKNRFDVFYISLEAARFLAFEAGLAGELNYRRLTDIPSRNYFLCFSKKWPGYEVLAKQFNSELSKMRADGSYETIHDKYR